MFLGEAVIRRNYIVITANYSLKKKKTSPSQRSQDSEKIITL
jgi:hypothetical protein